VNPCDHDDLAQLVDARESSRDDATPQIDRELDAELSSLRPVVDLLDRAGARMSPSRGKSVGPLLPERLETCCANKRPEPSFEPGSCLEPAGRRRQEPSRSSSPPQSDVATVASESGAGDLLGDFRLIRVIGRGGMGVVYEAVQKSLNRRVALKTLPVSSAADPRKVKRFLVEAQAAACLHHPHIVPVYLVGSDSGLHYYAMQFIQGRTLAAIIAELSLDRHVIAPDAQEGRAVIASTRRAAELCRQAALALQFAHEQGIIHRDIKPSNLLIDETGWLWVSDFGLARIAGESDLTLSGAVLGTLRYMSPEQAFGSRFAVDHRADIYSLGATLYELLTLRPVFEGDDRLELLRKVALEEPPAPRRIDSSIPRELDTIVRKAMAKSRDARYATAAELADDLGRFLENLPILARPPGAVERTAKWIRRHKPVTAAAALVVFLAILGVVGAGFWRDRMLRGHNRQLKAALVRAEENESAARRLWYDSQIRLAQQALASGQVDFAQEIVDAIEPDPGGRDPRGFEWRYLWPLCHRDVKLLVSQTSKATASAVAFSDQLLVTGHSDGTLVFWDFPRARERASARAHSQEVGGLRFSPDGRVLASWSLAPARPSEVALWDPSTGDLLARLPEAGGYVVALAFALEGKVLVFRNVACDGDESEATVVFWNLASGAARAVPGPQPIAGCRSMAIPPGGEWLATSASSGKVALRSPATGNTLKTLTQSFDGITRMAASPDGRTLAVADRTSIRFCDLETDREVGSVTRGGVVSALEFSRDGDRLAVLDDAHREVALVTGIRTKPRLVALEAASGGGLHFDLSPDGKTLAAGGIGRKVALWDTSSGKKLADFPRETGHLGCLRFAPGGESLIVSIENAPIRSWHLVKAPEPIERLAGHKAEVWAMAYTPDGSVLFSSADDHCIKLWDARDGKLRSTLKGHRALVASLAVSPDGKLLASAGFEGTVRLWDLPAGSPRSVLNGHTDRVRAVAFSPDGRFVASAGSDKTVRVWDAQSGKPAVVFAGHTNSVRAIAFHPHGRLLFSASDDRTIRGIEFETGREAFSMRRFHSKSALAFSRDGSLLASGDDRGNLTVWDTATWSMRRSVKGSDTPIFGLAFSADSRTLAAACGDAKVRLWDTLTGQVTLVLEGHEKRVNAVAFSPDGQTLASASHDGAIRLWHGARP
jgi:WD40 repeat protein/serine/threonine protein kinase